MDTPINVTFDIEGSEPVTRQLNPLSGGNGYEWTGQLQRDGGPDFQAEVRLTEPVASHKEKAGK